MDPLLLIVAVAAVGVSVVVALRSRRARATLDNSAQSRREALDSAERLDAAIGRSLQARDDLSMLLSAIDIGALRLDENLVVLSANSPAHMLFSRPLGGMQGRPLLEAIVDAAIEEHVRAEAASNPGGWTELELSPGRFVSLLLRPAANGGWWLLARDASEIARLRMIRTEFVENLSHELRTPVTAIGLIAELLAADAAGGASGVPPKMRERILQLESEAVHLGQMINELLDLARIESGEGARLTDSIDLDAITRSAVDRLAPFAAQAKVAVELESPGPKPLQRPGNAARLTQVVVNLIHNAIKFSPQGSTVRVVVASDPAQGRASVSVSDRGVGISRADLARIFERFFVADRSRATGGGTGLGLSIAKHIVEQHGGEISVQSALGEGSTFTVSLPNG